MGDGRQEGYWDQHWKLWEKFKQAKGTASHQGEVERVRQWLESNGWTSITGNRWVNATGVCIEIKEDAC